jgi:hypothetical protein
MTARNSALALALALCATAASAAIEIHMFVPGVPGESVSDGYRN